MTDNQKLLAEYAKNGSESAFRDLVIRYIDFVHSTALRLVGDDHHLAEDVTQTVFLHLARNAHRLIGTQLMLGGWLHRDACNVAAKVMRGQRRRQDRERQAAEMSALQDQSKDDLTQIAPLLDEAINQLGSEDRMAILLRFFEQRDFRAVGQALGSSEEAARKRVGRSLDKLQRLLRIRGVALSAVALGTALGSGLVKAAPSGLLANVVSTAIAGTASSGAGIAFFKIMATSKFSFGVASAVLLAGLVIAAKERGVERRLLDENALLRQQHLHSIEQAGRLSNQLAQVTGLATLSEDQNRELMRLRGEVTLLRRQLADRANDARNSVQAKEARSDSQSPAPKTDFYFVSGGGIALPGRRVFQPGLTVTGAIRACGGFTDAAIKTQAELTRAGGDTPLVIDLVAVEQGSAPDTQLMPGDRLFVPAPPPSGQ